MDRKASVLIRDGRFRNYENEVNDMIDVYLFSGFLGSGKTSLLLNVIQAIKSSRKKTSSLYE